MSYANFKITNVYSDDVHLQKLKLQAVFMAQFRQQLNNLTSSGGSHREVQEKYWSILDSILTHNEDELIEAPKTFIEAIANENVNLVISGQLLSEVGATLVQLEDSVSKAVSHFTLEVVQPHVISFEDQLVANGHQAAGAELEQGGQGAGGDPPRDQPEAVHRGL